VAAVDFLAEAFLNILPVVTSVWVGFEVLQALVEDFAVPHVVPLDSVQDDVLTSGEET
jgi:hypothetical protein